MKELEILLEHCKNKDIYCYGAGKYGKIVCAFLQENGIDITGFLVSEQPDKIKHIVDKPVYGFKESLFKNTHTLVIVSVGDVFRNQIIEILEKKGIQTYLCLSESTMDEMERRTNYSARLKTNKFINVLMYHRIKDVMIDTWKLAVSPHEFEEQIKYLKENYQILRMEDDWSKVTEPSIVITFDDGYVDNYIYALPILEKYRVPATIFVSTKNINKEDEFWWDELERIIFCNLNLPEKVHYRERVFLLNTIEEKKNVYNEFYWMLRRMSVEDREKELVKLKDILNCESKSRKEYRTMSEREIRIIAESPYITIGAHTETHSELTNQTEEEQLNEIVNSKERLEKIINKPITVFSYPFGLYSDKTMRILKESGFKKAVTTRGGLVGKNADLIQISRNVVDGKWNEEEFGRWLRKTEYWYSDCEECREKIK